MTGFSWRWEGIFLDAATRLLVYGLADSAICTWEDIGATSGLGCFFGAFQSRVFFVRRTGKAISYQ